MAEAFAFSAAFAALAWSPTSVVTVILSGSGNCASPDLKHSFPGLAPEETAEARGKTAILARRGDLCTFERHGNELGSSNNGSEKIVGKQQQMWRT